MSDDLYLKPDARFPRSRNEFIGDNFGSSDFGKMRTQRGSGRKLEFPAPLFPNNCEVNMGVVTHLATKFLKFKGNERGISTIAVIAFWTIVISCTASVIILSVSNGFHYSFMEKLMTKDPHISVIGIGDPIRDYEELVLEFEDMRGVEYAYPYFDGQALLKGNLSSVWAAFIKAVPIDHFQQDEAFRDNFEILEGEFDLESDKAIVLGENLADNLGVAVGSRVKVTVYNEDNFSLQFTFEVTGIFSAGYAEYDSGLAFISVDQAKIIFDSWDGVYGIGINLKNPMNCDKYLDDVKSLAPDYYLTTWKEQNEANLISLQNEKTLMYIILLIFFLVVFFNILSTMIAMILDKKQEIGILKAMGLKPGSTMNVFLFNGLLVGVGGSGLGLLTGLFFTISLNAILHGIEEIVDFVNYCSYSLVDPVLGISHPSHFQFFKSTVYYIDRFPIRIQFQDLAFVVILSVSVGVLAVLYPALTASKMRPVEVLRKD